MTATLGSISSGTMRAEDLIPAFMSALDDVKDDLITDGDANTKADVARIDDFLAELERRMVDDSGETRADYFSSDDACFDLEELGDRLDEHAPPYCYFGAHCGDGADFGFWLSIDALSDARREGYVLSVFDLSDVPADYCGEVLNTNDHGNMTLYVADGKDALREIWAVV